jgi:hypothetical protein|tara:strand:- start:739 stop:1449 length:711 start_codon:yes stop_codon:yes gene_type:complete
MAENTEMDAKDIAAQFRSIVEAEDQALLGDTSTFADQDFFIQLGWFADQIETRFKKNTPSPDTLAMMAALGGFMQIDNPNDGIDKAYEIWQAGDAKIRAATLCPREEIEENLSQVGVSFRLGAWPKNNDGRDTINQNFSPFMRLCIPDQKETALKSSYSSYVKDTHLGEKELNQKEIEGRLKEKTGSTFLTEALHTEGRKIVEWWMKQEAFEPLSFPKGSLGELTQIALNMIPEKS